MKKQECSTFYTDLDTILDTRLGVLQTHYDHLFPSVLNKYQYRWRDEFEGISEDEFKDVYSRRGKLELSKSIKSGIVDIILEFACETNEISKSGYLTVKPMVELNLYPYLLSTKDEKQIMAVLRHLLHDTCDIKIINEDPKDIGFEIINQRYSMMAMYSAYEWLDYHCGLDEERRKFSPTIGLLLPGFIRDPNHEEFRKNPSQFFKQFSEHLSPIIRTHVMSISYFNYKIPST